MVLGSNSSTLLDLLAPGVAILSAAPSNGWLSKTGTSMATPHVTGAWTLARQVKPKASVNEILSAFQTSGVPIRDTRNGVTTPRIAVDRALRRLAPASCYDGIDNDFDAAIDFPQDSDCNSGWDRENMACGLGFELVFVLAMLQRARRKQRSA